MLKTIEGTYHNGKIELVEVPDDVPEKTRVIVTFLETSRVDLQIRGIDTEQAADLRGRLAAFVEEWDCPEMDIYDDYDGAKK